MVYIYILKIIVMIIPKIHCLQNARQYSKTYTSNLILKTS